MAGPDTFKQLLDDLTADPTAAGAVRLVSHLLAHQPGASQTLRVHRLLHSKAGLKLKRAEPRHYSLLANAVPPLPSAKDPEAVRRGHESARRGRELERKVAGLFELQGYDVKVNVEVDGNEFDVWAEKTEGLMAFRVIVECKDLKDGAGRPELNTFESKLGYLRRKKSVAFEAMLISAHGFKTQAHEQAQTLGIRLATFDQLMRSLVDFKANLNAAIRGFEGTELERLYVEQDVVYQSDIQPGEGVAARPLTESVKEWIAKDGSTFLTLLGDFGSGKTSFCKRLACELARDARDDPEGHRIPVLIDLREGRSTTVTLDNLLTHHFRQLAPNKPLSTQALLQLNKEGYLVVFFDGFDEIVGYTEPSRYVEVLRQILATADGRAKVIMTCRTHYFRDRPDEVKTLGTPSNVLSDEGSTQLYAELRGRPGTEIGYLRELSEGQIDEYLRKAVDGGDWQDFRDEIRRTYNLKDLAERPFLLEMIVKTLPELSRHGGEVTLANLYEVYCESWFEHTDLRLALTREHKVAIVEFLACLLWNSTDQKIHHGELFDRLTEKIPDLFGDRQLTPHDKERIDFEVRTALFLRRDAEGRYQFIHRSFLEFFVARTLRAGIAELGSPGGGQVDGRGEAGVACLDLRPLTREVVFFLELWPEKQGIPRLAAAVLEHAYRKRVSENALHLLYLHAHSRLGPLVGAEAEDSTEIDVEALKSNFREVRPQRLELDGADLSGADLRGADLRGARLAAACLERADLRGAVLDEAELGRATLTLADLRAASLCEAKLGEAVLSNVDARGVDFRGADLGNADLAFGSFVRADFTGAHLDGAETQAAGFLGAAGLDVRPGRAAGPPVLAFAREPRCTPQQGHGSHVHGVAWSPDGRLVASGCGDGTVHIWDVLGGRLVRVLAGHCDATWTVAWHPDGTRLASASSDHTVKIWDPEKATAQATLGGHTGGVLSVAWNPSGTRLASASSDHTVKIWDPEKAIAQATLKDHTGEVPSVAWHPSGARLASASWDHTVKIWDVEKATASGELQATLGGHTGRVQSVAWNPSGTRLASGSWDHTVKIWDVEKATAQAILESHTNSVLSVVWHPSGTRLASASWDDTVKIWDAEKATVRATLEGHTNRVRSVAWNPSGTRLASASWDHTVKIWDPEKATAQATLGGQSSRVLSVAWNPSGTRLASASRGDTVKIWNPEKATVQASLEGHTNRVRSMAWNPSGTCLASASDDHTVKIWDAEKATVRTTLKGHTNFVWSVAWHPSGTRLASASDDHTVKIWDPEKATAQATLGGHTRGVRSVAWNPGGTRLASASLDGTVKIWDPEKATAEATLEGHTERVLSVAWHPSGARLASASYDHTVKVWDPEKATAEATLEGHARVLSVAWNPSGTRLASAFSDHTVKIWEVESGHLLHTLADHEGYLSRAIWHPDGVHLAAATGAGILYLWHLASAEPLCLARLYQASPVAGLVVTHDGHVDGPQKALDNVRFADGWALYDLDDLPERYSPARVREVLAFASGDMAATSARGS